MTGRMEDLFMDLFHDKRPINVVSSSLGAGLKSKTGLIWSLSLLIFVKTSVESLRRCRGRGIWGIFWEQVRVFFVSVLLWLSESLVTHSHTSQKRLLPPSLIKTSTWDERHSPNLSHLCPVVHHPPLCISIFLSSKAVFHTKRSDVWKLSYSQQLALAFPISFLFFG